MFLLGGPFRNFPLLALAVYRLRALTKQYAENYSTPVKVGYQSCKGMDEGREPYRLSYEQMMRRDPAPQIPTEQ